MPEYRIEKDSLGDVRVPADALYGAQTQRACENFKISGQRMPLTFLAAVAVIKRSAALANNELGLLSDIRKDAIQRACNRMVRGEFDNQFPVDVYQTGSGTSTNMNMNEVLASASNEDARQRLIHPNDHVNMSQSSNDVIPTAMHVSAAIEVQQRLLPVLGALRTALEQKSRAFDDVIKSGRTHLMDATPVRLGQEFSGYAAQVAAGMRRLNVALNELQELPLGGTATGSGINRHADFPRRAIAHISEATGITFREADNHFEAQANKDGYVMASGALNTLAVSLMKIANDIRLLSSGPTSGLAEIQLVPVQPGSSIMPGKVNPVLAEALMMACARVMGNHTTITVCGQHSNFELNVMMPVMAKSMLESIEILTGACRGFNELCVTGIRANRDRCRELLEHNPSIVTALNAFIGYDQAADIAKFAMAHDRTIREVVLERGLMTEEDLNVALNVRKMTEPGIPRR